LTSLYTSLDPMYTNNYTLYTYSAGCLQNENSRDR
jgi:hypothetical protein